MLNDKETGERKTLLRDPDDAPHDNTVARTETDKTLDKLSNERP